MDPFPNQEVSTGARDNHGNRKECQNEQENIFPNVSQLGDCIFTVTLSTTPGRVWQTPFF